MTAADDERSERIMQLSDPAKLRAVEFDLRNQLAQLEFQEDARAALYQADTFNKLASELAEMREGNKKAEDLRKHAEQAELKAAELPHDSFNEDISQFYEDLREFYRLLAQSDRRMADDKTLDSIRRQVTAKHVGANRRLTGQARRAAKKLRSRRILFRAVRVGRRIVAFVIAFGLFSYGMSQLFSGLPVRGVLSVLLAAGLFLLEQLLDKRATEYQERVYRRWLSGFVERVSWLRFQTEWRILADRALRRRQEQLESSYGLKTTEGETLPNSA
jgi:hypothetical protein